MRRLLAAVNARLEAYGERDDASAILDPRALAEAEELWRRAVATSGGTDGVPLEVVRAVAYLRWCRFMELPAGDDAADLDVAIDLFRRAVRLTDHAHPERMRYLVLLSIALQGRFERTAAAADLDAVVAAADDVVASTPPDDPDLAWRLKLLAGCRHTRYEYAGRLDDLETAVTLLRRAVRTATTDDPEWATYLADLAGAYRTRFLRVGDPDDLTAAVDAGRAAVRADHPDLATHRSILGLALLTRFTRSGDPADLDEAISTCSAAAAALAAGPARGALRAQLLDTLTGLDNLRRQHPDLAGRLDALHATLNRY